MSETYLTYSASKEVTIKDLRNLGCQGGATALLLDGREMKLTKEFGLVRRQGVVSGKVMPVDVIEFYTSIYNNIRTIKKDRVLVARRIKHGHKSVLLLTGKGYNRRQKLNSRSES